MIWATFRLKRKHCSACPNSWEIHDCKLCDVSNKSFSRIARESCNLLFTWMLNPAPYLVGCLPLLIRSAAVKLFWPKLTEVSVWSPRKVFIFIINKYIDMIEVSKLIAQVLLEWLVELERFKDLSTGGELVGITVTNRLLGFVCKSRIRARMQLGWVSTTQPGKQFRGSLSSEE